MKDLEKAYFGVMMRKMNGTGMEVHNLFNSCRVLDSIALYRTNEYVNRQFKTVDDVVSFCFGDTRGRAEYEMLVGSIFSGETVDKTDVYTMYVLPNKQLLYDMVQNFTIASCKRWKKKSTRLSRPARSK